MEDSSLLKQLASMDYFFYYGMNDFRDECKSELLQIIIQPKKSMFFFRNNGAGVKSCENFPSGLLMQLGITYGIANSVAVRNTYTTDGANGYPDRRIAVSQGSIEYEQDNSGNIDIRVYYYLYADLSSKNYLKMTTGAIQ